MGIFGRDDDESMDPQDLLARGHAEMAKSSRDGVSADGAGLPFRLTVADVFVIRGRGTVVTGVVESGFIRVGTPVQIEREGQVVAQAAITGVEMFRKTVDQAGPGDNVGLLLSDLDRAQVQSGDVLTA